MRSMKTPKFLAVVALWFLVGTAHADFSGVVVSVLDGDTVDVLVDSKPVRLAEIDAPEKAQAFGTKSRQALAAAVFTGRNRRGKRSATGRARVVEGARHETEFYASVGSSNLVNHV